MSVSAFAAAALLLSADTLDRRPRPAPQEAPMAAEHTMFERAFSGGWRLAGMAQAFPVVTVGRTSSGDTPLDDTGAWLTQVVGMINLESPGRRLALRVTPNLEGLTIADGEATYGGWGEGFLDRRHPHTLLHEAMLSVNAWDGTGGGFSLSAGKGFAPYGTGDPMARPVLKYPTNHHLSQILERFTLNASLLRDGWSLEAGLFGGSEPTGPYDLSNIDSFGDSWSVRAGRRFGAERMGAWRWEVLGSYGRVAHGEAAHHGDGAHGATDDHGAEADEPTHLVNGQVRFDGRAGGRGLYALVEASASQPHRDDDGYWSVLGEASVSLGAHRPYARLEVATRPEYEREGSSGDAFFRYDHDAEAFGSTEWTIATLGYGYVASRGSVSVRPFVEGQWFAMRPGRGGADPDVIFGADAAWSVSVGARIFLGGDPMRMGTYGVLDPMTRMGRTPMGGMAHHH